jgi:hypothetical protein
MLYLSGVFRLLNHRTNNERTRISKKRPPKTCGILTASIMNLFISPSYICRNLGSFPSIRQLSRDSTTSRTGSRRVQRSEKEVLRFLYEILVLRPEESNAIGVKKPSLDHRRHGSVCNSPLLRSLATLIHCHFNI